MNISKREAERYLTCILDAIMDNLKGDGRVVVQGFGSFRLKEYKARMSKKPITGEPIQLPVPLVESEVLSQDRGDLWRQPAEAQYGAFREPEPENSEAEGKRAPGNKGPYTEARKIHQGKEAAECHGIEQEPVVE